MNTTEIKIKFDAREILDITVAMSENEKVITVIMEKERMSRDEAELLFLDTLRFLYLSSISEKPLSPNTIIDIGWHHFILCTREYTKFCKKAFGYYIHHAPFTIGDKNGLEFNPAKETVEFAKSVFHTLSKNWYDQISAKCCDGGNCSNSEGGCSHCNDD